MENLKVTTQGVKGGNTKTEKVGYAMLELRHEQDRIIVDDFQGSGDSYKQRELQQIQIISNGKVLFNGDKYELFKILTDEKSFQS
jgi:hypothetical protein